MLTRLRMYWWVVKALWTCENSPRWWFCWGCEDIDDET